MVSSLLPSARDHELSERIAAGLAAIEASAADRASFNHAVDTLVERIDRLWHHRQYHEVPPEVLAAHEELVGDGEPLATQVWHAVLLRFAQLSLRDRLPKFPPPLAERIRTEYARIVRFAAEGNRYATSAGRFPHRNLLQKELGLARLTCVPAAGRVMDTYGVVPRRNLIVRLPASLPALWLTMVKLGGLSDYLSSHIHVPMLAGWGAGGGQNVAFFENLLITCQYFEMMPHLRGYLGAGWTVDPGLIEVSPHLVHAFTTPTQYGARLLELDTRPEDIEAAIGHSKTRQKAYEEGRYTPRVFMRIWGRDDAMRCADDYRAGRIELPDFSAKRRKTQA